MTAVTSNLGSGRVFSKVSFDHGKADVEVSTVNLTVTWVALDLEQRRELGRTFRGLA